MAIKFSVLRLGDKSDRGPSGECGILLLGEQAGLSHGETVHCPDLAHQHSKACAATALDAQSYVLTPAVLDDQGAVVTPAVTESPRQRIAAWFAAQVAKVTADDAAKAKVDPLPTKTVQKVVDGKQKSVVEVDRDLA